MDERPQSDYLSIKTAENMDGLWMREYKQTE